MTSSLFGQVFGDAAPAVPMPPPITAWSYSRLTTYEECPRRAKYQFVDKITEKENEAIVRGKSVHEAAATVLTTGASSFKDRDVQATLDPWLPKLAALRAMGALSEHSAAFDIDWRPCDWFGRRAWLRIVYDAIVPPVKGTMFVIDFKTGKPRESHAMQLSLYACGAHAMYPDVSIVEVAFAYLDYPQKLPTVGRFTPEQCMAARTVWEERASPMLRDTEFATRVGPGCRWCPYAKSKGGPCEQG